MRERCADLVILPEIHAEWNQQVADRDRRVDATLEGATAGSRTRVYGTELHRNGGLAGTAWTVRSSQGLDLRFGYDVGYGTDRVSHAVGVTINATW